jgi:hypothetical protein
MNEPNTDLETTTSKLNVFVNKMECHINIIHVT